MSSVIMRLNGAGEQRPKLIPCSHGLYVKPLSSSRLLHWLGYTLAPLLPLITEFYTEFVEKLYNFHINIGNADSFN